MKPFASVGAVVLGLGMAIGGPAMAADPVEGLWKTLPDDNGKYGFVQIAPCGDKLCGAWARAFDQSGASGASSSVRATITNSAGTTCGPWWICWKKACWPLVPGSPKTTGQVWRVTGDPSRCTRLPLDSISSCCRKDGRRRSAWA